ncbi:hypothetical protein T03_1349 [Trichinella britovi]|uniref:Uncharacterized protein n=1 Tax=Trichinella britovi TaxID=45882 RepID=A0A0V1CUK3_TRIBR|nr:hypothetical protein T03_9628 [Trichinella britovi]KRY52858.1 hypothetical protein T03_1349 [Trichinella britovi]
METYIVEDIIQESGFPILSKETTETCKRRQCGYCRRRKRTCVSGLNTAVYGGDECGECAFLVL